MRSPVASVLLSTSIRIAVTVPSAPSRISTIVPVTSPGDLDTSAPDFLSLRSLTAVPVDGPLVDLLTGSPVGVSPVDEPTPADGWALYPPPAVAPVAQAVDAAAPGPALAPVAPTAPVAVETPARPGRPLAVVYGGSHRPLLAG